MEVDETYIGGQEPELIGGRAKGKKVLTAIAVEVLQPRGFGWCRMSPVNDAHLIHYLNEFVFRFNRRQSRSRGMVFYRVLELAVQHGPVRYGDLIETKRPRSTPPVPPRTRGRPPSLERPPAERPWRAWRANSG